MIRLHKILNSWLQVGLNLKPVFTEGILHLGPGLLWALIKCPTVDSIARNARNFSPQPLSTWAHRAQVGQSLWARKLPSPDLKHPRTCEGCSTQTPRRRRRKALRLEWCCHSTLLLPPLISPFHKPSSPWFGHNADQKSWGPLVLLTSPFQNYISWNIHYTGYLSQI